MRAIFARYSMVYSVKEAFLTLQGEGRHAGRAAVFCRFSGCNLWTGREPTLQIDEALIAALHGQGFEIAVETNGTLPVPTSIDWICVSPKAGAPLRQTRGHELKLVFPQSGAEPEAFQSLDFAHFLLQPMDGPEILRNREAAIDYCLRHPRWRLSLQTHKIIGVK